MRPKMKFCSAKKSLFTLVFIAGTWPTICSVVVYCYVVGHGGENEIKSMFVLIFWSVIYYFIKYSHEQMFPFR